MPGSARWASVIGVAGVILFVSVVQSPLRGRVAGPLGLVGVDTWLHVLGYAALALALLWALQDGTRSPPTIVGIVVVATIGYGVGIELLQGWLPTRRFECVDVAADALGVLAVVLGWRGGTRLHRTWRSRRASASR